MLIIDTRSCFVKRSHSEARRPLIRKIDYSSPSSWKWCPKMLLFVITVGMFILWMKLQNNKFNEPSILPNLLDLKFILLWTPSNFYPFEFWKTGQDLFIESKCPVSNCYFTSQRDFFGGDVSKFDAIAFNGRNLQSWNPFDLPKQRSPHQKYIFVNMESSDNEPICDPIFDRFFNWTATYKLNSEIVFSYLLIMNMAGDEVGPRLNMTWIEDMSEINETLVHTLKKKTKAAAWFVSHCDTRNEREKYARSLRYALKKYNLTLDVYGRCGDLKCPRSTDKYKCEDMLRDQYFFYLSFENSFAEDYITEKVLTALDNSVVPIVYGGSNYSRFLPPGSYLDAKLHEPEELATLMAHLIASPAAYHNYFRWRNYYRYHYPEIVCRLCAGLNDNTLRSPKVYDNFRGWWHPDHQRRCLDEDWGLSWIETIKLKLLSFLYLDIL